MALSREELMNFMEAELGLEVGELDDKSLLFSTGIIDSFMLVTLMAFVEKKGNFRIDPADVTLDNLDSIERILWFTKRMSAG